MSISSDEVNFLIYRYLQENGFSHSAFSFAYESLVIKSSVAQSEIPPGALITFLQKGLEYIAIEEHINEDGSVQEFENTYSLLSPMICEAVAVKEDKNFRSRAAVPGSGSGDGGVPMDQDLGASSSSFSSATAPDGSTAASAGTGGNAAGGGGSSERVAGEGDGAGEEKKLPLVVPPSTVRLVKEGSSRFLRLSGHQGEVFMCVWNPAMNQLASGSADGMCRLWGLWDMTAQKWASTEKDSEVALTSAVMPHAQYEKEKYRDVTSITWSPDGQQLATGCYDGTARVWSNQGRLVMVLIEHTGPVFAMKWSKSGGYILSGSYDKRTIVWNARTGAIFRIFSIHSAPVLDVDWTSLDIFASCSSDKTISVCHVSNAESGAFRTFSGHASEVNAVCWSPCGTMIASCSDDGTAKVWAVGSGGSVPASALGDSQMQARVHGGLLFDLVGHSREIFTLKWTPTGEGSANPDKKLFLCTASFDGTVKTWSGLTGELVYSFTNNSQPVYSLAPSPDGELVAMGTLGGNVSIWSIHSGTMVREAFGTGDTFDVSWSRDGTLLCACFSSGNLYIFDTAAKADNV